MSSPHTNPLVGVWSLLSFELRFDDGSSVLPWGPNVCGQVIYTNEGFMSGSLMRGDRPAFAVDNAASGTHEEFKMAMTTYIGYAGRYTYRGSLSGDAPTDGVIHHAEVSAFPNWAGTDIERTVHIDDDGLLALGTPPLDYGDRTGVATLIWQRRPAG
jgi:Lipocalin-like domain